MAGEPKEPGMELSELPDEMLMQVLSRLPPRALLQVVPAVCRRWRDLSRDRGVWQDCGLRVRGITQTSPPPPHLYCDVSLEHAIKLLRVAPCVKFLDLSSVCSFPPGSRMQLVSAPCSIAHLRLPAWGTCRWIEAWLVKQAKCLRGLHLPFQKLHLVLEMNLQDLTLVSCGVKEFSQDLIVSVRENMTGLKRLSLPCTAPVALMTALITGSAHRLEEVDLIGSHDFSLTGDKPLIELGPAVAAVGQCKQLRSAKLPAVKEFAALSSCGLLVSLALMVPNKIQADDLIPFFRNAVQLKYLSFSLCVAPSKCVCQWIIALSSSCRSDLTGLSFTIYGFVIGLPRYIRVPKVLSRLPRLRSLTFKDDMAIPYFLGSQLVRSLQIVDLSDIFTVNKCPLKELRGIVRKNPQLHIIGCKKTVCFSPRHTDLHDCLPLLRPKFHSNQLVCNLFSHSVSDTCFVCKDCRNGGLMIQVRLD